MKTLFGNKRIWIHLGEGDIGRFKEFKGRRTERAIRMALKKERAEGLWAYAYVDACEKATGLEGRVLDGILDAEGANQLRP